MVWHDYGIWEDVTKALDQLERREGCGLRSISGTSLVYWKKTQRGEHDDPADALRAAAREPER